MVGGCHDASVLRSTHYGRRVRRAGRGTLAAVAVLLCSACATPQPGADPAATTFATAWTEHEPGTGLLLLSDLDADDDRFDGPVQTVDAVLRMRPDDCLVVVVDGVEHVPFWPEGTTLFAQRRSPDESAADPDAATTWGVALPGGSTLRVGGADQGEAFTAQAVVAGAAGAADARLRPWARSPTSSTRTWPRAGSLAPPIAFPDAAAIVTQWEQTHADLPADPAPSPHAERADPSNPHTIEISVDEHQFTLGSLGEDLGTDVFPALPVVWGLTATSAMVGTGVASGSVRVTCIGLDAVPDVVDPAWEDVVELSLATTPDGPLTAAGGWSVDEPCDRLDEHGPGTYRVRVHARGRDTDYDGVAFEPVEDYLVLAWPAPSSAPVGLRATSEVARSETSRN